MARIAQDIVLDLTNAAGVDQFSEAINTERLFGISFQCVTTGTVAAVLKIQVSNNDGVSWSDLASPTVTIANAGNQAITIPDFYYQYVRLWYDATSGTTNTVKVYFSSKGY